MFKVTASRADCTIIVTDGENVGGKEGPKLGTVVGLVDGVIVGEVGKLETEGVILGAPEADGPKEGESVGEIEGLRLGTLEGISLGMSEGLLEGFIEGEIEGLTDGFDDGEFEGLGLGAGLSVGTTEGLFVGLIVPVGFVDGAVDGLGLGAGESVGASVTTGVDVLLEWTTLYGGEEEAVTFVGAFVGTFTLSTTIVEFEDSTIAFTLEAKRLTKIAKNFIRTLLFLLRSSEQEWKSPPIK